MSHTGWMLFFAILPVVLILWFVYKKDKDKEPISLLIGFFIMGIVSCFLVLNVSDILGIFLPFMNKELETMSFIEVFLYAFIGVALTEEVCKWVMVYFKGYNHKEFDEIYDILVYSIFVSLGFAFFENLLYVFSSGTIALALLRAVSAIPGHACDAVFMGYYLSLAKQCKLLRKHEKEKKYLWMSVLIPALLHGIYDFCLMSGITILILFFLVFVIYLYVISIGKLNKLSKANKNMKQRQHNTINAQMVQTPVNQQTVQQQRSFCTNCGERLMGNFCTRCGTKNM